MTHLRCLTAVALTLGICTPAAADRFHFSAPDAEEMQQRIIEGVLLKEENGNYVIRVEGGEITVPKSTVQKIEKDGLTVAKLEEREKNAREALAQANLEREAARRAEATVRENLRESARAAEASASRASEVVEETAGVAIYDPVIGRVSPIDMAVEHEIRRELGGHIRRAVQRELRQVRRELRRLGRLRR